MTYTTVGVVDYGMGNHASVIHSLLELGFRVRVSAETDVLNRADVLVLPGVGAFPSAMQALHNRGLVDYLQEQARVHRPILGICLGMELLATASHEHRYTPGLDLIPGEVRAMTSPKWHIGWNTVECVKRDSLFATSNRQVFYFNHSFYYDGPTEYQVCLTQHSGPFPSVIRRGNVVGVQFHPEKSQLAGRTLLKAMISGLSGA